VTFFDRNPLHVSPEDGRYKIDNGCGYYAIGFLTFAVFLEHQMHKIKGGQYRASKYFTLRHIGVCAIFVGGILFFILSFLKKQEIIINEVISIPFEYAVLITAGGLCAVVLSYALSFLVPYAKNFWVTLKYSMEHTSENPLFVSIVECKEGLLDFVKQTVDKCFNKGKLCYRFFRFKISCKFR
jgi:hypothetical protein